MRRYKTFFTWLFAISVFISFLLTAILMIPAIDQNSSSEYCALIEEGSKEVANWSSQGRPCTLKSNVFSESLGIFFGSSILLFILFSLFGLLGIGFMQSLRNFARKEFDKSSNSRK